MTAIALLADDAVGSCAIDLSEDWRDALVFTDINGNPIVLDGIDFHVQIKKASGGTLVVFTLSTDNGLLQILPASATVTVLAGGMGYAIGDKIYGAGGAFITPMIFKVTGVNAGVVTSAQMLNTGFYSALPNNPIAQGSTTGGGSGATFNLTYINNALVFLVPLANFPPIFVADAYAFKVTAIADGFTKNVATVALTAS